MEKRLLKITNETNLEKIKEVTIFLLQFSIRICDDGSVEHPIFNSKTVYYKDRAYNLLEPAELQFILSVYKKLILSKRIVLDCLNFIRKDYRLTFLKYAKPYLSANDFARLLGDAWTFGENVNTDANVPISEVARWFRNSNKRQLMLSSEYITYASLPEYFLVYRGVAPGHNQNGMSWTRELDIAEQFASNKKNGYILSGIAKAKDVLAFFDRREEEEIVIEAKKVKLKRRIASQFI